MTNDLQHAYATWQVDPNQSPVRCSPEINELAAALAKAQVTMMTADKDDENPHFKSPFASLPSCIKATKALAENGIAKFFIPTPDDHMVTRLVHESGQWIECEIVCDSDMQPRGSAFTYARRYGLCALAGIAQDEPDDDGNEAGKLPNKPQALKTGADLAKQIEGEVEIQEIRREYWDAFSVREPEKRDPEKMAYWTPHPNAIRRSRPKQGGGKYWYWSLPAELVDTDWQRELQDWAVTDEREEAVADLLGEADAAQGNDGPSPVIEGRIPTDDEEPMFAEKTVRKVRRRKKVAS